MAGVIDHYDHARECQRIGLPNFEWCCEDCAARIGVDFLGIGYEAGGWCQVGKHRAVGRTTWLQVTYDQITPWPKQPTDTIGDAFRAALARYQGEEDALRAVIDRQFGGSPPVATDRAAAQLFIECVSLVLDI